MASIDCEYNEFSGPITDCTFDSVDVLLEEYEPILINESDWVDNFNLDEELENETLDMLDDIEYFSDEVDNVINGEEY